MVKDYGTRGCRGNYGQFVAKDRRTSVELYTNSYNSYWIARVTDENGIPQDVARILSIHKTIYTAYAVFRSPDFGSMC